MFSSDPLRVHLSLVSHTNIGKTTLARTLLSRDVGEVADRPHVTETTDDYVLARDPAGCELVLWDTPGFGNSVRLAERLRGRSNPIGWFLSEIWDRFTDKAFFLDQRVVRHIRDTSSVVLYLVNVTERPDRAGYIPAEMEILSWIGKPVIVLLNQMGDPSRAKEKEEIEAWQKALAPYPFVHKILPMDAFARCWVQEVALFDAIGEALPESLSASYASLREVWVRGRRAVYASSVEAIAHHLTHLLTMTELVPTPSLKDQAISMAQRFGFLKDKTDVVKDAQASLSADAADSFCALTNRLLLHLFARIDRGSLASIPFPLSSPSLNAAKDRRPLSRCHDSLRLFHARCQVPSVPFPRSSDRRLRHRGCILHITSLRVKYLLKNC